MQKVLAVLQDELSEMPKNWNRRFKHNRDKIKTGDIYELAEVVRNLAIREYEKGLSTGEKQMFTRAKKILASELMYALEKDEDEAEAVPRRPARRSSAERLAAAAEVAPDVGGRAGRGRRTWRTPWVPRSQGVRHAVGAVRCSSGASTRCGPCPRSGTVVVALPPGARGAGGDVGRRRRRRSARTPCARRCTTRWPATSSSCTTPRGRC